MNHQSALEVHRNRNGNASNSSSGGGHVAPRLPTEPTNQPEMADPMATEHRAPAQAFSTGGGWDELDRLGGLVVLLRVAATILATILARTSRAPTANLPPAERGGSPPSSGRAGPALAPPKTVALPSPPTRVQRPGSAKSAAKGGRRRLPTADVTAKLLLLLLTALIAVVSHSEAGTCWLRRIESTGKCSQLFARNVTRESCCGAGSGAKGFSEKDISDVEQFFIHAFNDGMACSSCLDTCDRAKCAPNKRCVMRRNRPKCICAPTCSGGGGGGRSSRRNNNNNNNRPHHRMHQMQHQQRQHQQQHQQHLHEPHFHQQNIKVINLSESQRNRRQYFADDGRQPRPRQLRYSPEAPDARRRASVKKPSLRSDQPDRRPAASASAAAAAARGGSSSQRAASAQDSAKDKQAARQPHNLLVTSVTLVSSSSKGSSSISSSTSSSSGSTSTSKGTSGNYRPSSAANSGGERSAQTGPSTTTTAEPADPWTGGERMVLLQDDPNGLALTDPTERKGAGKHSKADKGGSPSSTGGRHHRKPAGTITSTTSTNETLATAGTHRKMLPAGDGDRKPPFAAFGKPKLLRVGGKSAGRLAGNGTARGGTVRVPRREPAYLDDVFIVDNFHHRRGGEQQQQRPRAPMDDFLGNEIMHHSNFYNPVCGTDGRTYKTECQLKKRACRQEITSLVVAYKGHCQTSCKFVKCPDGKRCIEDQNATPHCVTCGGTDCRSDRSPKTVVCGADGITYPSICELKRQACLNGRAIPVAYRGRCIEAATCETIKCKDRQQCLTDLKTHKPRCVSCSYKCPRMKRQQGHGKPLRNAKSNPFGELNIKLCGTNNRTYHSWCHMQKDSCNTGFYIDVLHSGSCPYGR